MKKKKPTIKDIAREAGVSTSTVSRVINNNYPVHDATRRKVEEVISKRRFQPNYFARGMISNKTRTVGVLVPSLINVFFPVVVTSIENYLKSHGFTLFLCDTEASEKEERAYIHRLIEKNVEGIICLDPSTPNILSGFYEKMSGETPLVLVNAYNEGVKCNFVLNNQKRGTMEALEYLAGLGHTNIALLRGSKSYSSALKEEYYLSFMGKKSFPIREENIITIPSGNDLETVQHSMKKVHERLLEPHPPTAILACNDWMAVGARNAVKKLHKTVPCHLSLIGFDNTIIAELCEPKLSSVTLNMEDLGRVASELLLEIIEKPSFVPQRRYLPTSLVHRESCAPLKE